MSDHEFLLLVKRIFVDSLTFEDVKLFEVCHLPQLNIPERLISGPDASQVDILRHLKHNNTIRNWYGNPQSLKKALKEIKRQDLARSVDSHFSGQTGKDELGLSHSHPELGQQESGQQVSTSAEDIIMPSLQESVGETDSTSFRLRSNKRDKAKTLSAVSNASSGYGSFKGQDQLGALLLVKNGRSSTVLRNSFLEPLAEQQSINQHPESDVSCLDQPISRDRTQSLPDSSTLIRDRVLSRIKSSRNSPKSSNSEPTNPSMSQISSDNYNGTDHGSKEEVSKSTRLETFSSVCITGRVQLSIETVLSNISQHVCQPHKSHPFPRDSDSLQFELHFFSVGACEESCELILVIPNDYLKKKAERAHTDPDTLNIKAMDVTAKISVATQSISYPQRVGEGECIAYATENVPAESIQELSEFVSSEQKGLTVASFRNLLKHSKLENFRDGNILIQVEVKYTAQ